MAGQRRIEEVPDAHFPFGLAQVHGVGNAKALDPVRSAGRVEQQFAGIERPILLHFRFALFFGSAAHASEPGVAVSSAGLDLRGKV